jgi:hypothetical protein
MREPPARALPPCTHAASAPTRTSDRRRIGTHRTEALPSGGNWLDGVAFGALGVLCFSGTAVATRVAVPAYGAVTLTGARFLIAAALAAIALGVMRSPPPGRDTLVGLLALGVGVAALYPLFLALAVERVPAYHAAVNSHSSPPRPQSWRQCDMPSGRRCASGWLAPSAWPRS